MISFSHADMWRLINVSPANEVVHRKFSIRIRSENHMKTWFYSRKINFRVSTFTEMHKQGNAQSRSSGKGEKEQCTKVFMHVRNYALIMKSQIAFTSKKYRVSIHTWQLPFSYSDWHIDLRKSFEFTSCQWPE